jgi:uncharacterized membrane protein (UPF0182 family)
MRRIFSWTIITIVVVSFFFASSIINFVTDWWWFSEVNFTEIFIKSLTTQLLVGSVVGIFAAGFLLTNILVAAHSKIPWHATLPESLFGRPVSVNDRIIKKILIPLSVIFSFLIGLIASSFWPEVLKFFAASPFANQDPLFNQNIGFYVFSIPVYNIALGILKILLIISLILCAVIYVLRRIFSFGELFSKLSGQNKDGHSFHYDATVTSHKARTHLAILLSLFLLATAATTYLSLYDLLIRQSGPVFGAAFTDATVLIPILQVSAFIYLLAALFALIYGLSGKLMPLISAFAIIIITNVISLIVPPVVQRFIVAPNELVKETPFIKYNIAATREGYNLQNVFEQKINADQPLTPEDIAENNLTIKNVRLWDREPLLSTFSQIQEIRTYYEFASVDNDRYLLNGELRQIMLSPRELQSNSLPNRNWINEHLTFTHGYGIAAGPVNQVTPEGLPVLFVKNLPPVTDVKELEIKRPEIYFGEITNDYVIVNSNSKEFDYPKGEENVYTKYSGTGGVPTDSFLKRVLYALQFNELKMILSSDVTDKSRIIYNRNVKERVQKIVPFLTFDKDPYLVVADSKLYWILDAYTTTDRYPYSEQTPTQNGQINYIRNSVKAVVDAYNGSVTLYRVDENDPIINTYSKIFPNSFKPISQMPKSLVPHIRYPEDIFTMQTNMYTTYHMHDPQIFYNKEDQWEVPGVAPAAGASETTETAMAPRHMIMKLPNVDKEEFILMLPFTPRSKDNLSAWMVARNDGADYGKIVVYSFPKDKLVFGPKQIIGRINQDPEVSRQIALWDQRGSQVIQGPLLVIPIEESLVYVRPLYLKAETGKIPELKRVIVAYENKIAMDETLEKALARIFGTNANAAPTQTPVQPGKPTPTPGANPQTNQPSSNELNQASEAYAAALEAQRNGDWAKYGEEIKRLGEILQDLKQ